MNTIIRVLIQVLVLAIIAGCGVANATTISCVETPGDMPGQVVCSSDLQSVSAGGCGNECVSITGTTPIGQLVPTDPARPAVAFLTELGGKVSDQIALTIRDVGGGVAEVGIQVASDTETQVNLPNGFKGVPETGGHDVISGINPKDQTPINRFQGQNGGVIAEPGLVVTVQSDLDTPPASQPTGQTGAGKSDILFDAASGMLSLTPVPLSSAYVTSAVGVIDANQLDPVFLGDPILGATISASPFTLITGFSDNGVEKFVFDSADNLLTIAKGADTFLTASFLGMVFDPTLQIPFYAPLTNIELNTTLGSAFITQLQSRLDDPRELPFDLFISPSLNFLQATDNFTVSATVSASIAISQDIFVPEPSALLLLSTGLVGLLCYGWRQRYDHRLQWRTRALAAAVGLAGASELQSPPMRFATRFANTSL